LLGWEKKVNRTRKRAPIQRYISRERETGTLRQRPKKQEKGGGTASDT